MHTNQNISYEPAQLPIKENVNEFIDAQIKELKLKVANNQDKHQIADILNRYLSYPSSQLAILHKQANKLGQLDLKNQPSQKNMRETMIRVQHQICGCCGFYIQKEQLKLCNHNLNDVNHLGSSTVVFFKTIINVALLLIVMILIYSVFSLATNISIAQRVKTSNYLVISLSSKNSDQSSDNQKASDFYYASSWLGVAMVIMWGILFVFLKIQVKQTQINPNESTSVSDYSIVIQKMPYGLTHDEVQEQFNQYYNRIKEIMEIPFRYFKIQKYNEGKPFYFNQDQFKDEQFIQIHKDSKQLKEELIGWIKERQQFQEFSSTHLYRKQRLQKFRINLAKKNKKYNEIVNIIRNKLQQKSQYSKTAVFITFQTIQQRNFFLQNNNNDIINRIKRIFPCINQQNRFSIVQNGHQFRNLIIEPAPEPQDITWGNIGISDCQSFLRKLFTFAITFVILGISFVIVYALSTVQQQNSSQRYISLLISLFISFINLLIIKVIQFSTTLQRPYTMNNFQISLAVKSIIAQLVNSIFIPFMVNYYIKSNIYGDSGLTEDIFILAITNSFLPPLVRWIDPYHIFVRLQAYYYDLPQNKLWINQYELNRYSQKMQFQLGYEYIYPVSLFLFVCFFVSLQPIIPFFALLGLFFMYWLQKYALFNKSQRPVPGTDIVSFTVYQMLYLGAVFYALGSLTWSSFVPDSSFRNSLVPNLIAAGLGTIIFFFPYGIFVHNNEYFQNKKNYIDRRVYFPSQYDRLNPTTAEKAVHEYKQFLVQKKIEITSLPQQIQQQMGKQFLNIIQQNVYKGHNKANNIFGNQDSIAINNLFYNECRNTVNPMLLKQVLINIVPPQTENKNFITKSAGQGYKNTLEPEDHNLEYHKTASKDNNYQASSRNWKEQTNQHLYDDFKPQNSQVKNMKNIFKSNIFLGDIADTHTHQKNIHFSQRKKQ